MGHSAPRVRRLKAPDGRQWLGRLIHETEAAKLLTALGIDSSDLMPRTAQAVTTMIMEHGKRLRLSPDLFLKQSRFMGNNRLEIHGNTHHYRMLKSLGCFAEYANGSIRMFIPLNNDEIIEAIISKFPVTEILND